MRRNKLRTLQLIGDVDSDMTKATVNYVNYLKNYPDRCADVVEVILCTEGGYVVDGMAIYDLLTGIPNPIHIHCVGACMSSGTIILGAGDFRTATPNTQFLVHFGSMYSDSEDTMKHNKYVNDLTKDIVAGYTGKTKRTITSWYKLQKFFMAEKAVKLGFIHEVQK